MHVAGAAQTSQHLARAGIGRDDQVGPRLHHEPQDGAAAHPRAEPGDEPANRREAEQKPVLEVEEPVEARLLERRLLADELLDDAADLGDRIADLDHRIRARFHDPVADHPRRQVMPLADCGGEDEDAGRSGQPLTTRQPATPVPAA